MDIKIINAGNCVLCGRKIKVTKQRNCKHCHWWDEPRESEVSDENSD